MRYAAGSLAIVALVATTTQGAGMDLENLVLAPESYWNGSDGAGGFASGGAWFSNGYGVDTYYNMEFWGGWAYSNKSDITTGDYTNQYSAITGAAQSGSIYAVGYVDTYNGWIPTITLAAPGVVETVYVTNTTYAYLLMRNGDPNSYSKQFGGPTGGDPDWFLLTITGKDAGGAAIDTVKFYLADYRFADSADDYLVNAWTPVDLSPLGAVKSLVFTLTSSDSGAWGMNTPAYFALDTLTPEPATLALVAAGSAWVLARRRPKG